MGLTCRVKLSYSCSPYCSVSTWPPANWLDSRSLSQSRRSCPRPRVLAHNTSCSSCSLITDLSGQMALLAFSPPPCSYPPPERRAGVLRSSWRAADSPSSSFTASTQRSIPRLLKTRYFHYCSWKIALTPMQWSMHVQVKFLEMGDFDFSIPPTAIWMSYSN